MTDDSIQLRQPTADEIRAFVQPTGEAFAETFSEAELDLEKRLWELDRLIGAVDGERWIGTGGAYTFDVTVPGGTAVGAAGITLIAVTPSHRRRGILRLMMGWLFEQARERNEPLAVLWASESAIYQHFGFGMGTLQSAFDIERPRFTFSRPAAPLGRIRLVENDEAARLFPPIYDAMRIRTPGAVSRSDARWRNDLLDDPESRRAAHGVKYRAVLEVDGEARGYAIYRAKSEWNEMGPNNTVLVFEVTGLDAAAERAVWEWLAGIDLVGHIKATRGPVPHPLVLQLTEPRRLGLNVRDATWIRLIDMQAALEARSYAAAGSLTFELTDEFCPWNAGRWRLDIDRDGRGTVAASDAEPDLALDTADLASVYLGTFTIADLARAGRARECRPDAVRDADRLLATAGAPWCSTMF
jgi:predicted acetyltransferase